MRIKEVEEKTGLTRSSVRFYEKENLIHPKRNEQNGYKDYSNQDVENLKKIAYLRTLGISIEEIHLIIEHKVELSEIIQKQYHVLAQQIDELEQAKSICQMMMEETQLDYENLNIEMFVPKVKDYWEANQKVFKLDSMKTVRTLGGNIVWAIIMILCTVTAIIAYDYLPGQIPIQWSEGVVISQAGKIYIFAYPIACLVIRFILHPYLVKWLHRRFLCGELISYCISNCLCFIALTIQVFTILYVLQVLTDISVILIVDAIVFVVVVLLGWKYQ